MHTSPSVGGSLSPGSSKVTRTALHHSLVLLAAVVLFAVIGLGAAHNWPKVLRVSLAFGSYATVLLVGSRLRSFTHPGAAVPYWLFVVAGATAGLVSGTVRPTIQPAVVLVSVAAGAFLISTVHWAGARRYDAILTKVL